MKSLHLVSNHDSGLAALIALQQTLHKAALPVRNPVGLLGVVRLGLSLPIGF